MQGNQTPNYLSETNANDVTDRSAAGNEGLQPVQSAGNHTSTESRLIRSLFLIGLKKACSRSDWMKHLGRV